MDNYKINHELNQYDVAEGIEFDGLMPKFMDAIGMTTGNNGSSSKLFEFHPAGGSSLEVVDVDAIMDNGDEPWPGPEPKPEIKATFETILDEASWNASYSDGGLKDYYEWCDGGATKPYKEDLWNGTLQRAANWNDWVKDENNEPILDEHEYIIYTDDGTMEGTPCVRCWLGALNAPEAKYPWCVVIPPTDFVGKIKFVYDGGEPIYPFGEESKAFSRGFAIISIPATFGMEYILDEEGHTTFDSSKLDVTLIPE